MHSSFDLDEIIRQARLPKPDLTPEMIEWRTECLAAMGKQHYYPISKKADTPEIVEFLEAMFGKKSNGTFVEVGGNNGDYSNSCGLADIGWRGVYVEPVPVLAQQCAIRHSLNQVDSWNCAAGADFRTIELTVDHVDGGLTTAFPELMEFHQSVVYKQSNQNFGQHKIFAQILPLNSILRESKIEPNFELLVVDVEGMEPQVFSGFDLNHYRPQMLVVELVDFHEPSKNMPMLESHTETRNHILAHGYSTLKMIGQNTVFVLE